MKDHQKVKMFTLACIVLHNVCLEIGDTIPSKLDLSIDPTTNQTRDRQKIRKILHIGFSRKGFEAGGYQASKMRKPSPKNFGKREKVNRTKISKQISSDLTMIFRAEMSRILVSLLPLPKFLRWHLSQFIFI